jgi:hypothetical protein
MTEPKSTLPADHPWHFDRRNELEQLLEEAEEKFGNRIPDKKLEGVILGTENRTLSRSDTNKVYVSLNEKSEHDFDWARFQLAHECIHVLAPVPATNYLEEGLANHNSLHNRFMAPDRAPNFRDVIQRNSVRRHDALEMVEALLASGGNIKDLRQVQPYTASTSE